MASPPKVEPTDGFHSWFNALEQRHLADLTFQEVRKSIQALSARYVERRGKALADALSSRGKRAAFALYYAPLHFLTVRSVLHDLDVGSPRRIVDLGCGTGVAGAAWALRERTGATVAAYDLNAWAVAEARWTLRRFGVRGTAQRRDIAGLALDDAPGIVAAFTINELPDDERGRILARLSDAARKGSSVLIVEPIARRSVRWWDEWSATLGTVGGKDRLWRFTSDLPERLRLLDKASGLDHRTLTARSIFVPEGSGR